MEGWVSILVCLVFSLTISYAGKSNPKYTGSVTEHISSISIEIFNLDGSGNIGEECWYSCDRKSGDCSNFCGQDALCCREGWKENGCDGAMGGDMCHICVSKDPSLKIAKSPYCSVKSNTYSLRNYILLFQITLAMSTGKSKMSSMNK